MTQHAVPFHHRGQYVVAELGGDIDITNVEHVRMQMAEAVGHDAHGLVVDLAGVRYIDSAGVHMLFELLRRLQARRQGLAISLPDDSPLATLLRITSVDDAAPVRPTVDGCIEALAADVGLY